MWPVLERTGRYLRAAYIDLRLFVTGKSDPELPPLRLRFVGPGDFREVGEHLLDLTLTRGRLRPDSRLLDIGCGTGRLALPLTRYLVDGEYEGFDVVGPAIRWCSRHITRRYPNFHFKHVSLKNPDYSLRGGAASRFVFPYPDSHFDCVVAYSLFTHLGFDEMHNYLEQAWRVLMPSGRLIASFFLLNQRSTTAQATVPGVEQFPFAEGPVRFASRANPALAVAIEEGVLLELLRTCGYRVVSVEPGAWYGLQNAVTFQDLVVCEKAE